MPLFTSPNKKASPDKSTLPLDTPPPLLPENLELPKMPETFEGEELEIPEIPEIHSQTQKIPDIGEIPPVDLEAHDETPPSFPLPSSSNKEALEEQYTSQQKTAEKNIFDTSPDNTPLFPEIPAQETINFEEKLEQPISFTSQKESLFTPQTPAVAPQEVTSLFSTSVKTAPKQPIHEEQQKTVSFDHFFISVSQYRDTVVANNELKHVLDTTHDTLFRLMQLHNDKDLLLTIWQQSLESGHHKITAMDDILFKVR
ncbi:hypothetical protein HYY69_08055 [Candidatus Woesearchaeota archaeon]|nr:hypothetical protein [Candidatus Woesearchaeota archaeon]